MQEFIFNYKIIKILGEGGMSRVYLAEDSITGQQVAIKELLPNLAHNQDLRERFRREAQIMAKLDHPNIVKLLRYEETETSFYLMMEYVDGMDLEQYIKNVTGPISEPKSIEIMSTLLDAFGYAHEKGVIHRDIKPANIIITRDGIVKVLDFGIAKITDDNNVSKTKTGTRIGTVAYMSPEQVNAIPDIDLRTDIYSLGVLLFHMISGSAPYDSTVSSDFEIQTKIVKEPLQKAKTIYPYASDFLQQLIDKATAKDRNSRFLNCDEFKLALFHKSSSPPELVNTEDPFLSSTELEVNSRKTLVGILVIVIFFALIALIVTQSSKSNSNNDYYTTPDTTAIDTTAAVVADTTPAVDTNEPSNLIDFLSDKNGKYPGDINLFGNTTFTSRLESLLGDDRYSFVIEKWNLDYPIEITDNIFVATGCEEHNCDATNFIIVLDLNNNVLYAGIRENILVQKFSENGESCAQLDEWSKQ